MGLEKWLPNVGKQKEQDNEKHPLLEEDKEFWFGREVSAPRSDGSIDEGWKVERVEGNDIYVQQLKTNDRKKVDRWALRAVNWEKKEGETPFFKVNDTVQVLRSNLVDWEKGYVVKEILDGEVYLEKPIPDSTPVKKKTVPWSYVLPVSSGG